MKRTAEGVRRLFLSVAVALLSLVFPGVGQAYAGRVRRGAIFAAAAALWSLAYHASPYGAVFGPNLAPLILSVLAAGAALALGAAGDAFRLMRRGWPVRPGALRRWLLYAAFVAVPALPGLAAPMGWAHYSIPSASMVPTLRVGDHVLAVEGYYRHFAPRRGDLVAFEENGILFLKRLVGLPGDRVEMRNGALVINGALVPLEPVEPVQLRSPDCAPGVYPRFLETLPGGSRHAVVEDCGPGALRDMAPIDVPPGHYFMLGDNRDDSEDSRDPVGGVGLVPEDELVARVLFIAYSIDSAGRVRWSRIGVGLE